MPKFKQHQYDFIRRVGNSLTDRQIARRLGVRVKDVRQARAQLASTEGNRNPEVSAQFPDRAPGRWSRAFGWVGLAGLCALAMYYMMMPIFNGDFGWHAALGRYIVENRMVPTTEPFSHTALGVPMVAHEWLAQVAYHVVIQSLGVHGLRWLDAALVGGMLIWLYRLLRYQRVTPALALCGVCLYFILAHDRFQHRPYLFHMAFFMVMYGYVFIRKPALPAGRLAGIFALTVVWVNAHSAVALFSTVVVLYVVVEFIQRALGWRRPQTEDLGQGDLRRLAVLAIAVMVALVITPNHFRLFPYLVESKRFNSVWSEEWVSILRYWADPSLKYSVIGFAVVAGATLVTAGIAVRRHSPAYLAVVLFLALLPLTGLRFIAAAFAPVLLIFPELNRWLAANDGKRFRYVGWVTRWCPTIGAVLLIVITVYPISWSKVTAYERRLTADWNFHKSTFPIAAMDFLDAVDLEGRLFNPKKWGGYILFRTYTKYPVFMDGRWVTFGARIYQDTTTIRWKRPGAAAKLDEYGIDILLVHRDYVTTERRDREKWTPVFENYNSGVYLRNTARNADNFQKCAAFYHSRGIPFNARRGFDEHLAYLANRDWAESVSIARHHLSMGKRRFVRGW